MGETIKTNKGSFIVGDVSEVIECSKSLPQNINIDALKYLQEEMNRSLNEAKEKFLRETESSVVTVDYMGYTAETLEFGLQRNIVTIHVTSRKNILGWPDGFLQEDNDHFYFDSPSIETETLL